MWAHKISTIFITLRHHPSYHFRWPYVFCGSGDLFLVCNITLPCDQREVYVDVGYWPYFLWVMVNEVLFWVWIVLGEWDIILGWRGRLRHYFGWVGHSLWGCVGGLIFWVSGDEWGWVGASRGECTVCDYWKKKIRWKKTKNGFHHHGQILAWC